MALNDVIYNKKVDVAQAMPVPVVFAKQNDNAKRKVVVTLVKNGQPFVLGTGVNGYIQGATAPNPVTKRQIKFKRDLTAIDTTQGTATFIITESMTAEIGITQCEVSIYDTEKPQEILCTANINIEVQGTGMSPEDEMASDDYQAIVSIKTEVTAMRDEVRTKTNQAIAAQAAAETAAQNAYNSALNVQKIVAGNEAYTKQEADLRYSVAPRKAQASITGELKLTDADYGLSYLELQGNSEQYTAAGTNLFDVKQLVKNMQTLAPDTTVVLFDSGEKVIEFSNTSFHDKRMYEFKNDITKSYKFGVWVKWVSGSDPGTLYIIAKYKDGSIGVITSVGKALEYTEISGTIPQGKEIDYIYFSFGNDAKYRLALDSFYLYPVDAPSDEKPTGGYGTPSPEYPSEVKSVGDIPKDSNGVEIRNLLNEEWLRSQPISSWLDGTNNSYYINIGEMIPQEKRKDLGYFVELTNQNTIEGLDSQTYISVSSIGGANRSMLLVNGNTPQRGSSADLRTYPDLNLVIWKNNSTMTKEEIIHYYLTHFRYMVTYVKGEDIDEYRPYIGENNGLIRLESSGINRAVVGNGPVYITGVNRIEVNTWTPRKIVLAQKNKTASWAYVELNVERGKTYTFYCKAKVEVIEGTQTDGVTSIGFRQYPLGGVMYGKTMLSQDGQYKDIYNTTEVIPDDAPNMAFMLYLCASSASNGNVKMTIEDLMVVEGERTLQEMKALKYHPYHQQVTWIPLREPLRGLTGANLKLYADKVDKNGYVTQNIYLKQGKDMATFDTDAIGINTSSNPYKYAYWKVQVATELPHWSTISVLCNMLKRGTYNVNQMAITNTLVIVFNLPNTLTGLADAETDKAAITAAIKAWVNTNNPMVYYALKNPIEYQIPAVYIETYDQETNVRCLNKVKPSSMGLDYKIAISSLIKRLEALESAAVNNGGK